MYSATRINILTILGNPIKSLIVTTNFFKKRLSWWHWVPALSLLSNSNLIIRRRSLLLISHEIALSWLCILEHDVYLRVHILRQEDCRWMYAERSSRVNIVWRAVHFSLQCCTAVQSQHFLPRSGPWLSLSRHWCTPSVSWLYNRLTGCKMQSYTMLSLYRRVFVFLYLACYSHYDLTTAELLTSKEHGMKVALDRVNGHVTGDLFRPPVFLLAKWSTWNFGDGSFSYNRITLQNFQMFYIIRS